MPILTRKQLDQIKKVILDGATALSITTFGDTVDDADLQRLVDEGYIDPQKVDNLILDAYTLGRLLAHLPTAKNMSFNQFKRHVELHPLPMSDAEREAYFVAAQRAGTFCRGLGNRYDEKTGEIAVNVDMELAKKLQQGIAREVSTSIYRREGKNTLVRRLRQMSGQMTRDWARIAATESHMAHQEGFFRATVERQGNEVRLAKIPDTRACEACLKAYRGPDKKPIIHPASWWEANGTNNVGRRKKEWKPVLGGMHPWCLTPGQLITTAAGLVPIEKINIGDWVLTPKGRYRPVSTIYRRYYSGNVIELITRGMAELQNGIYYLTKPFITRRLTITPNHKIERSDGIYIPAEKFEVGNKVKIFALGPLSHEFIEREIRKSATLYFCLSPVGFPVCAYVLDNVFQILTGTSIISENHKIEEMYDFLLDFSKQVLSDNELLLNLDEGFSKHPKLSNYYEYAAVQMKVLQAGDENKKQEYQDQDLQVEMGVSEITKIENLKYQGYVYNLGVEDDEAYLAAGIAVHNCQCQLVEVPPGFEFDENDVLIPKKEFKKAEFSGSSGAGGQYPASIGGMGNWGNPARSPGQNLFNTEPVTEWPPLLDRPKRKRKKLQHPADRFDVIGRRKSDGGWANPPRYEQVQAEHGEVDRSIRSSGFSGERYMDELKERQKIRKKDRGIPVLNVNLKWPVRYR